VGHPGRVAHEQHGGRQLAGQHRRVEVHRGQPGVHPGGELVTQAEQRILVPVNEDPAILLTPLGAEVLARLAAEPDAATLAIGARLRREYPAALVATAMAQQELRTTAAAKFSRAADMLFTRAGYEQSSSETIARYRASRLAHAARVADLCCGIGGDLIALAGASHAGASNVLAVDRDPTHARLARHNAAVYGADVYGADVYGAGVYTTAVVADVRDLRLTGLDAVFVDPARRSSTGRFRPGQSEPSLDWCTALTQQVKAVVIKAAPGLPEELIPDGWEAEFIAESRDLKEAVLWSPALASAPRRATVLAPAAKGEPPRSHTLTAHPGEPVKVTEPGEYLLDPSPAVTRASLVEDLARELGAGAAKIDPRIAFLTLDHAVLTPFARTLRVLESAPWNEKHFAKRARDLGIGSADIRRRGLAGDVDQIRKRLKLTGSDRATIVITRVNDKPWGLICVDPAL
jgi:predicted O-methyltransferase YrrM